MFSLAHLTASLAILASLPANVLALNKITRTGKYLYNPDGSRFYIKGVAYQPQGTISGSSGFVEPTDFVDPLADDAGCARDIPFLKQLTVNTIRVYSVDASKNHDSCMQALSAAGIYTVIDLSLPVNGSINRAAPAWTTSLLDQYIATINTFNKYGDQILAYGIGNEVVIANDVTSAAAAAFVKAAARDTKAYLNSIKSSALTTYSAVDGDKNWIVPFADYLSCDPSGNNDGASSIDLYGLNNYEICGNQTFEQGYGASTQAFSNLNVPAYFSEFGCVNPAPRVWADVAALFSSQAVPVWSGGIAFSYFPATSSDGQFGMVNVSGSTVTTGQDFANLVTAYSAVQFTNSPAQSSAPAASYPACTSSDAFTVSSSLPPTPNLAACECLDKQLSCLFTPEVSNTSAIIGELFNAACALLGTAGSNCDAISANGTTGKYGAVSFCPTETQLSYVMTQYYENQNQNVQACSFAGNGTVNPNAATNVASVNSAVSSCLASASGVSTPTSPASSSAGSSGSSSGSGSSNSSGSGNSSGSAGLHAGAGVVLVLLAGVLGGAATLA